MIGKEEEKERARRGDGKEEEEGREELRGFCEARGYDKLR